MLGLNVSGMHHPWRELRALKQLDVHWKDLGDDGPQGKIEGCTITLTTGMTQVERRCALTHELIHHERGILPVHDPAEEAAVEGEVARRLISIDGLIWVTKLGLSIELAAEELWVREDLLVRRVRSPMHPAERAQWRAALREIADDQPC